MGGFSYFCGLCLMNCYILQESNCLLDALLSISFFFLNEQSASTG